MRIYGHRGARGEMPENTLAGFRHALATGVDGIELDVRLSADRELVVIHDDTTDRTTGHPGRVNDFSAAELAAMDAAFDAPTALRPQKVPSLREVLALCRDLDYLQLETKPVPAGLRPLIVEQLVKLFRELDLYARAHVTSFDRDILDRVHAEDVAIGLGYVCEDLQQEPVATAVDIGAGIVALDWQLVTPELVQQAKRAGLECSVWTVNEMDIAERMKQWGVDSIITDYPGKMVTQLHVD